MHIKLELEDLVPNALIEMVESNTGRIISYQKVLQYGNCITQELKKKNIESSLFIYRDKTINFEQEYKDIFVFFENYDNRYIELRENINTNYLRTRFRTRESLEVLIAMTSDNSRKVLGIKEKANKLILKNNK